MHLGYKVMIDKYYNQTREKIQNAMMLRALHAGDISHIEYARLKKTAEPAAFIFTDSGIIRIPLDAITEAINPASVVKAAAGFYNVFTSGMISAFEANANAERAFVEFRNSTI